MKRIQVVLLLFAAISVFAVTKAAADNGKSSTSL